MTSLTGEIRFQDIGPGIYRLHTDKETFILVGDTLQLQTLRKQTGSTVTLQGQVKREEFTTAMTGNPILELA